MEQISQKLASTNEPLGEFMSVDPYILRKQQQSDLQQRRVSNIIDSAEISQMIEEETESENVLDHD